MQRFLLSGSFDPPTLGHCDLIQRAQALCDELVVGIGSNSEKCSTLFTPQERIELLQKACSSLEKVRFAFFSGLVVDYAKEIKASCLLRGVRHAEDLLYEQQMAYVNRHLTGIDTLFLVSDPQYALISSSLLKEIAGRGQRLHSFLPESIENCVFQRLHQVLSLNQKCSSPSLFEEK